MTLVKAAIFVRACKNCRQGSTLLIKGVARAGALEADVSNELIKYECYLPKVSAENQQNNYPKPAFEYWVLLAESLLEIGKQQKKSLVLKRERL